MSKKFRGSRRDRPETDDRSSLIERLGATTRTHQNKPGYFEPLDVGTIRLKHSVKPRTQGQSYFWDNIRSDSPISLCIGPAGTGKTFLTVAAAVKALVEGKYERVIVTRPAVESDEQLGFLPGGIDAKMLPYMMPIIDCLVDLVGGRSADFLFEKKVFEVRPFAFMRGSTFKKSFVIADEMSNATPHQFKCLLTRIGEGSKLVVSGDPTQSDLPVNTKNGLSDFLDKYRAHFNGAGVPPRNFTVDFFGDQDIVRHDAVKEVLEVYDSSLKAEAR